MHWVESFYAATEDDLLNELIRRPTDNRTPCTAAELGLPETMSGDEPLVSVVVRTYEDDHYIIDALETIARQTYQNIELVIVDSSNAGWLSQLSVDRE